MMEKHKTRALRLIALKPLVRFQSATIKTVHIEQTTIMDALKTKMVIMGAMGSLVVGGVKDE